MVCFFASSGVTVFPVFALTADAKKQATLDGEATKGGMVLKKQSSDAVQGAQEEQNSLKAWQSIFSRKFAVWS